MRELALFLLLSSSKSQKLLGNKKPVICYKCLYVEELILFYNVQKKVISVSPTLFINYISQNKITVTKTVSHFHCQEGNDHQIDVHIKYRMSMWNNCGITKKLNKDDLKSSITFNRDIPSQKVMCSYVVTC